MSGILFNRIDGREGSVRIPALGTLIARIQPTGNWTLKRRADDGSKESLFDLRAVFHYRNQHLLAHPEYKDKREIIVKLGRREYRLEPTEDAAESLEGNVLEIKGVRLCPL